MDKESKQKEGNIVLKYTLDESVAEFEKRKKFAEKKRHKRNERALFSGVGVLSVMLIISLFNVIGLNAPGQGNSNYGSFLLSPESGGYIVVAIIAFVLGILLTIAVLYRNGRLKEKKNSK